MTVRTRIGGTFLVGAVATISIVAAGCSAEADEADAGVSSTSELDADATDATDLPTDADAETTDTTPAAATAPFETTDASELGADEITGLLWIREEEQLAHDVYTALHELWDLRIFENISASETTHIESVLRTLDRFGIVDPVAGNEPGSFANPQIQELYDRLVADGSASLEDALAVGAYVEELDISDLRASSAATDSAVLIDLYAKLEKGSRNHLRAFTSQLELRDAGYQPTELDTEAFDEIVSSPMERGHDA